MNIAVQQIYKLLLITYDEKIDIKYAIKNTRINLNNITTLSHYSYYPFSLLLLPFLTYQYLNVCFKESRKFIFRAAFNGRRGRYAHAYGICAHFYYISIRVAFQVFFLEK